MEDLKKQKENTWIIQTWLQCAHSLMEWIQLQMSRMKVYEAIVRWFYRFLLLNLTGREDWHGFLFSKFKGVVDWFGCHPMADKLLWLILLCSFVFNSWILCVGVIYCFEQFHLWTYMQLSLTYTFSILV